MTTDEALKLAERLNEGVDRDICDAEDAMKSAATALLTLATERDDLLPYVEAFRREEVRADKEATRADELQRRLDEAERMAREIGASIYNDNGDVTWSPLRIRQAVRAFLSKQESKG